MAELQSIFPDGVCDWSKRGLNHVGVVVGTSYGPAPPLRGRRTVASRRVSELCMRRSMAFRAQCDQIVLGIVPPLAPPLEVMDLQAGDGAASLAPPSIALEDFSALLPAFLNVSICSASESAAFACHRSRAVPAISFQDHFRGCGEKRNSASVDRSPQ